MSERYRQADEHFGGEILSERERKHRRDIQKDVRRKNSLKDGTKRVAKAAGIGIPLVAGGTAAGAEVLQSMDGKPLGSFAGVERSAQAFPKPPQSERDRRVSDAIARAQDSVAAGEPAPQSGVIEIDEGDTTGYVDLQSPDPTDTTPATGTGGVSAEAEPDTGGISPDSTS